MSQGSGLLLSTDQAAGHVGLGPDALTFQACTFGVPSPAHAECKFGGRQGLEALDRIAFFCCEHGQALNGAAAGLASAPSKLSLFCTCIQPFTPRQRDEIQAAM